MNRNKPLLYRSRLYILSTAVGAAVCGVLLLPAALFMCLFSLPADAAGLFSLFALGGGCAVSGFITGNVRKRHGLATGLRSGLLLFLLCAAASAVSGGADLGGIAAKGLVAVITGCFGGVIGVNYDR